MWLIFFWLISCGFGFCIQKGGTKKQNYSDIFVTEYDSPDSYKMAATSSTTSDNSSDEHRDWKVIEVSTDDQVRRQLLECFRFLNQHALWIDWDRHGPVGWRFNPTDFELVNHHLRTKKYGGGGSICKGLFGDFDLYKYDPDDISTDKVHRHLNGRMYIFTPLHKRHITGKKRGRRVTPNGHWKINAAPVPVGDDLNNNGQGIGTKSSLTFFNRNNEKTQWLMYEFRLEDPSCRPPQEDDENEMSLVLDPVVLAVVYLAKE